MSDPTIVIRWYNLPPVLQRVPVVTNLGLCENVSKYLALLAVMIVSGHLLNTIHTIGVGGVDYSEYGTIPSWPSSTGFGY